MASNNTYSTRALSGKPVIGGRSGDSRIGKVARFIFHPTQKRCVGFVVKRPDLALMFHRPDMFIPLDSFKVEGDAVVVNDQGKDAIGPAAVRRLGLNWDKCVMWEGMPLLKESGEEFGTVGDIVFSCKTGKIESVAAERGSTSKALLGQMIIPYDLIVGFRVGVGVELANEWTENESGEEELLRGAIIVSNEVGLALTQGGVAEAAGHQVARAQEKVRSVANSVAPKVESAKKKTGQAVGKGAFVTGRQLGRAKGMFAAFKDEYDKASGKHDKRKKQ